MKPVFKHLAVTVVGSIFLGALAVIPIASSDNGYVAGYIVLPIVMLIGAISLVLILAGIITIKKKVGPFLLLSALLVPTGFIGAALFVKQLEIGAYRESPMVPMISDVSNIVVFTQGVTDDEISGFWDGTLSIDREDGKGHYPLPGIRSIGRLSARDGHEVVEFDFFPTATGEQREYVYTRVRSSPIVFRLFENVPTKEQ